MTEFLSVMSNKYLVIFLHGYGANGKDLLSLKEFFAPFIENAVFYAPNAPEICEQAFGMQDSYQWFGLADYNINRIKIEAEKSYAWLNDYIEELKKKENVASENVILIGFSQGTMMSLYYALNNGEEIKCVIGYSGRIINDEKPENINNITKNIALIHGTEDEIVPYDNLHITQEFLNELDIETKICSCFGLAHSINEEGIKFAQEFLKDIL